jgi:hypothetical protein
MVSDATPDHVPPPCKCSEAEPGSEDIVQESTSDNPYWVLRCRHKRIVVRTPTLLMPR